MALIDDLIAYFNLDEATTGAAAVVDYHENSNANNLRDIGSAVIANPSGDPNGKGNREWPNNADNHGFDTIDDGGDFYQTSTGPLSLAFWVAPRNFAVNFNVLTRWDNLDNNWQQWRTGFTTGNRKMYFGCRSDAATVNYITASDSTMSSGVFQFVACGYDVDSDVLWISIDNCSRYTTGGPGGIWHKSQNNFFTVGAIYAAHDPASAHRGWLARLGFWSRTITDEEIAKLWNGGNGLTYPFVSGANRAQCGECGDLGPGGRSKLYLPPFHPLP